MESRVRENLTHGSERGHLETRPAQSLVDWGASAPGGLLYRIREYEERAEIRARKAEERVCDERDRDRLDVKVNESEEK
jgi:hypothetical protein